MKYIASCSFGKDSLAMVLMLIEKKYPLDEVVFYDTGKEFQAIYDMRDNLLPMLENKGIKYTELKSKMTFDHKMFEKPVKGRQSRSCNDCLYCKVLFNDKLKAFNPSQCQNSNSKFHLETDDCGKLPWNKGCSKHDNGSSKITHYGYGWCGGTCRWGTTDKLQALDTYCKEQNAICYIGIAADEYNRLIKEKPSWKQHPLAEWGMTEQDCLRVCHYYGYNWLEGDIELYDVLDRVSCWCCRNKNLKELKGIFQHLPQYWEKLKAIQSKLTEPMKGIGKSVFDLEERFKIELEKERMMKMNKNLFVSKMKLHGDNQTELAEGIGVSVQRLNAKINETGGAEFTQGEIQRIKDRYALTNDEVNNIFFN